MRSSRALLALVSCAAIAFGASADERYRDGERWVPSFEFSFDTLSQRWRAAIESSDILGPPLPEGCNNDGSGQLCSDPGNEQPLTPEGRGGDTAVAALVGGAVELMTPSLTATHAPGRPRLFGHAGVAQPVAFDRNIAGAGDPGRIQLPPPPEGGGEPFVNATTVQGQGNRARSELVAPVISAGGGLAFSLELFDRRIRIKPSFEYLRQEIELSGVAGRAIQLENIDDRQTLSNFRTASFSASKTVVHHGLGGGLELEVDTQRLGPFLLAVFVRGRIYELLGDLDEELSATNEFGERVSWRFEPESLVLRGAAGLRFRYVGAGG